MGAKESRSLRSVAVDSDSPENYRDSDQTNLDKLSGPQLGGFSFAVISKHIRSCFLPRLDRRPPSPRLLPLTSIRVSPNTQR